MSSQRQSRMSLSHLCKRYSNYTIKLTFLKAVNTFIQQWCITFFHGAIREYCGKTRSGSKCRKNGPSFNNKMKQKWTKTTPRRKNRQAGRQRTAVQADITHTHTSGEWEETIRSVTMGNSWGCNKWQVYGFWAIESRRMGDGDLWWW